MEPLRPPFREQKEDQLYVDWGARGLDHFYHRCGGETTEERGIIVGDAYYAKVYVACSVNGLRLFLTVFEAFRRLLWGHAGTKTGSF